ncbi:MAG: TetR/AcrR family transcriptional regulator [Clostridiaceae bacterium]
MRKKDAEIKKTLLACANRIECSEGVGAISIRRLASEANIAVGTVYNYFESKQEVLMALTETYWKEALVEMHKRISAERFGDQLQEIITFLRSKMNDCAEILMRSLRDDAEAGRMRMASMQRVLRQSLVERIDRDSAIPTCVWTESFTKEAFADFAFNNILSLLQRKDEDAITFLVIVNRTLYPLQESTYAETK